MDKTRVKFTWDKVLNALRWIAISGVATVALKESLELLAQLNLPDTLVLVFNAIINVLIFAIAKYNEGAES
jgi:hypothetical protein